MTNQEVFLDAFLDHQVTHCKEGSSISFHQNLIVEEPLSIRIQDKPHSVVMRTPGNEIPHAAGFCFVEGIIDTLDDFSSLTFCEEKDTNVVNVTLKPSRRDKILQHLERRKIISQTSFGVSGEEMVKDLCHLIHPLTNETIIDISMALSCAEKLPHHQPLGKSTCASHAAALFNSNSDLLSVAEDVGRHNALDKAIGKLFLDRKIREASVLILSSRISHELVQKAGRARVPIVLAISRPTTLAVKLASELNITLACLAKRGGLYIFCGENRLKR